MDLDFIYILFDPNLINTIIVLLEIDAINISKKYSNYKVEIFIKPVNNIGYIPTFNYYKNGEYFIGII